MLRYQELVYKYLLRRMRNPEDARELAQTTFMRFLISSIVGNVPISNERGFLLRIARNLLIDWIRRRHINPVSLTSDIESAQIPDPDQDPVAVITAQEDGAAIIAVLNKLPERDRTCFELHVLEGLIYQEIGKELGIAAITVRRSVTATLALMSAAIDRPERRR